MKIAILGTKGIPNNYGGYEQFAEFISQKLVIKGHSVTVYNPSFHSFKEKNFNGVEIITKFSPEKFIGGAANFIYDYLCLKDALKRDFDIIYEAGYHSVAISLKFLKVKKLKSPILITNMDGLEYNRSKWNPFTQRLIKKLESIAVAESPFMISDNLGIKEYYRNNFNKESFFIPYGADVVKHFEEKHLFLRGVEKNKYFMLVARLEPENSIEIILEGYLKLNSDLPFIVVGNHETKYGKFLKEKYSSKRIKYVGGIYNKEELDSLRHFSLIYFHGHSVGGTNPSLLEAMACGCFIAAHDNEFNRAVLFDSAKYFKDADSVLELIDLSSKMDEFRRGSIEENYKRIETQYNWDNVVNLHEQLFNDIKGKSN